MKIFSAEKQNIITSEKLTDIFFSGIKQEQKLGVEFEKIPVKNTNYAAVEFFFKNGILDFLDCLKSTTGAVPYFENDIMLGMYYNNGAISLEPGSQVEYSLRPFANIFDIEDNFKKYNDTTSVIAEKMGITFLGLGIQPVSTYKNIKIIPKNRYKFMTNYLGKQASLPYVMMRETAGVQVSIDYSSEEDAMLKLSTALKLSPFLSALFSNSPIRAGKLSGYKSFRSNAWLNTDNQRCGLVSSKLFDKELDFSFKDYADILLDLPMIFKGQEYVGDITFRELLNKNKNLNFVDWETHLSLFFPDVRLKNYIEIRNHDCQNMGLNLAIPAIYKGIFYNSRKLDEVNMFLGKFQYSDFLFAKETAPKKGMDFSINDIPVIEIIKTIVDIANEGLKDFGLREEKYLEPIYELLHDKVTPADIIIQNFEGSWNRDVSKLIAYSKIG